MTTTAELEPYGGGQLEEYQARLAMTPAQAKALDEQVRLCTQAVLREGTDYGVIPGTGGGKTLWRPGAQKLLQWFGLSCTCERVEVERDEQGRKHGITYRATVARRMPDGTLLVLATCEGTADYDESKFFQTAEEAQRKARERELRNARQYNRDPNPDKWQGLGEYRADWNALMKRAQKRAIVGAVVDATAAGGIFSEREEDDTPAPQDDGPSWYEQALEAALSFTHVDAGRALYVGATEAHRQGRCSKRQQDHIQNRITQRVRKLQDAAPVDVEDLARQAAAGEPEPDPTPPAAPAATSTATGSSTAPGADGPSDAPGDDRHRNFLAAVSKQLERLRIPGKERLWAVGKLAGVADLASLSDLDPDELATVTDALAKCKTRPELEALLATAGEGGGGE